MKMMRLISLILALLLPGCALFAPDAGTRPPEGMPGQFLMETGGEAATANWWTAFGSEELNGLVDQALGGNFDILIAMARLKQASAEARKAGAEMYPWLTGEAGASAARSYKKPGRDANHVYSESEDYSIGAAASYEVDLWGKLLSQREAETAATAASRFDLDAAAVTVAANVVTTWVDLLAVRREIRILEGQIKNNETILGVQRLRFRNALASALDISQQEEVVAASKAELPPLLAEEQTLINSLAELLGSADPASVKVSQWELPKVPPLPDAGLPVQLLQARPDIQAAQMEFMSAQWDVSAAKADRLPNLTLSASAAFSSAYIESVFTSWMSNLAAQLAGPIFDAGYRQAEVDRTLAVAEEKLATYGQTVIGAVREVQDGLVTESRQREYIELLQAELNVARLAQDEARLRYLKGLIDYLPYMTELMNVQALERTLVRQQAVLIKERVTLYRTIGGDWTRELVNVGDDGQPEAGNDPIQKNDTQGARS